MSKLLTGDGRTHIESRLMRESLQNRSVVRDADSASDFRILPDTVLVGIGGQSIFDRGKSALVPLADELRALRGKHKLVVGVGGGTRVRHTVSVALDLGLPVGGIAQLVGAMEELNSVLLNALLAKDGFIGMPRDHFWELPLYLDAGMIPIVISIPPYHMWEPPPSQGNVPAHGSDFGLFQLAEVLAMKQVVFVKDEDGLYNKDPKQHKDAVLIPEITLDELRANPPETSILDRMLFDAWDHARNIERVDIVNGLVPGRLTAALAGERVGTTITRPRAAKESADV